MTYKELFKKILVNSIFIPLLFVFSYVIPKKGNLILLGSGFGYKFMGNPKYFYLWMIRENKKDFDFCWITRNKAIYSELKGKGFPVVSMYSLEGIWRILKASIFIVEQSSQDIGGTTFILGNYKIINTMHGTPLKDVSIEEQVKGKTILDIIFKFGIDRERKKYTMIACAGETMRNLRVSLKNNNIKLLGYPRDDIFFGKDLFYKNYRDEFNLGKYKKVLLYAPTLRDHKAFSSPFSGIFLKKLSNFLKKKNYLLLLRTHPLSGDEFKTKNLSNIIDTFGIVDDIQEILINTDILITDYSSVIFEFLLTNRPIIYYPFDYDDYVANSRKMYLDYYKDIPGPFAKNEDELSVLIKNVNKWSEEKAYMERYKDFKDRFHKYQDGKSSERLYKLLNSLA